MKTNNKSFVFTIILILGFILLGSAQKLENIFLDQDYWAAKPSIANIEANISKGHSIFEANGGGFDATTYALFAENPLSTIKYLVEKGNDVNKRTHDSRTYIFWAASRGNLEAMEYFIQKGAKMNLKDSHGYSVSSFAAAGGQQDPAMFDFFIANGADLKNEKDHHGANILLVAISRAKDLKFIDYLVAKGLDINTTNNDGNGIFHYAAQGGNIALLKELKKRGVNTSKNTITGENAILFASRGGRGRSNGLEVFEYLAGLGLHANITSNNGITPLHNLSQSSEDLTIYEYFIHKGVNPNTIDNDGNIALLNAAANNKLEVVKYLSEKTENINHTNKVGHSALALAVQHNSIQVVDYLISKGANTSILDEKGNNLAYYLFGSRGETRDFDAKVTALKNKGFDFKQLQGDHSSVWHLAVSKNNLGLLKSVSTFGANINGKDKDGNTPLHYAAMKSDNTEILKYLIANGADTKLTTEFGETAYDLATENELLAKNKVNLQFLN
ncbi:ankyrin repeat domain-containing protein [Cellulophaga sp. F20128]|uniref:ankyrin repeat domain-containing protein n=1 Tax=Cellulophaga sp. F20128 TaxID=2926413 RepID=UPI001FF47019|nr:ankyrin repeat domain-containing protein [Cellulophaga sp. F20128]MCK0156578.1 ankyrin repeat domain-containing protein [Cellulophaga sp. F20128]